MSKLRDVVVSDDEQTVYLVDEYKDILAQMSMSWFYIVYPQRTNKPTIQELKSVLLRFYQDTSGFDHKKLKHPKRKVLGKSTKVSKCVDEL